MRTLAQDLRFALRMSLKSPGFTLVAVLTLAVGIAASTTVFSWIDDVLVRPIPGVGNGHELLSLESLTPNGEPMPSSYPDYQDLRDHLKLLASLAMTSQAPLSIGEEDHAERVWGELSGAVSGGGGAGRELRAGDPGGADRSELGAAVRVGGAGASACQPHFFQDSSDAIWQRRQRKA